MNGSNYRSEEHSGMLDSPKSSAHRDSASRDTTIQTTCATLPPEYYKPETTKDVNMSFTEAATEVQPTQPAPADTMDSLTSDFSKLRTMKPPEKGANGKDVIEFVKYQLDLIGRDTEILDALLLLGAGRTERLEGGAASPFCCISTHIRAQHACSAVYMLSSITFSRNHA